MGHTVDRCITMLGDANEPKVAYIATTETRSEMMSVASISVCLFHISFETVHHSIKYATATYFAIRNCPTHLSQKLCHGLY